MFDSLIWLLYWSDVISSLDYVFLVLAIFFGVAFLFMWVGSVDFLDEEQNENVHTKGILRNFLIASIVFLILSVLIPSQKTINEILAIKQYEMGVSIVYLDENDICLWEKANNKKLGK